MIHFFYLIGFALFVAIVFSVLASGNSKTKILYGVKIFAQFFFISLILAWVFYFIPW